MNKRKNALFWSIKIPVADTAAVEKIPVTDTVQGDVTIFGDGGRVIFLGDVNV